MTTPLAGRVADWLDARIPDGAPVALAYSGGGDSHALLCLAAQWSRQTGRPLTALIVDHGLRPESCAESERALAAAARLGVAAHRIVWSGARPATGLQNAARRFRHAALARACRDRGIADLLTAHTRDDQAETVLMRLAAGGGWRAAAGMEWISPSPVWPQGYGIRLLRPLLGTARAELRGWLTEAGESWIEDPSNRDTRFTRIRIRRRLAQYRSAGFDPARLAAFADDLRALHAAEARAAARLADTVLEFHEWGGIGIDRERLAAAAPVIRHRLIAAAALAVSGASSAPSLDTAARLAAALIERRTATAHGVQVLDWRGRGWMIRDSGPVLGRVDRPARELVTEVDDTIRIWDGRFSVQCVSRNGRAGPLGRPYFGLADPSCLDDIPGAARPTLLAFRRGENVVSIAGLQYASEDFSGRAESLLIHRFCTHLLPAGPPPWFDTPDRRCTHNWHTGPAMPISVARPTF